MQIKKFVAIGFLAVIIGAIPSLAQITKSPLLRTFPGWGVQAWYDNGWSANWSELAEAFHFSPDGSYYHVLDENVVLKIAATFDVKKAITGHRISIDGAGVVQVFLDGNFLDPWVNDEHRVYEVDLSPGRHTIVMYNNSYIENANVGLIVVGKCLWGTDANISFVKAGLPDSE